jgi:hypothetical protein
MPNHISNLLQITGERLFIDEIVGQKFSFATTVPPPPNTVSHQSIDDSKWFVDHWGTKWDAYEVETPSVSQKPRQNKTVMSIRFLTAWSPPRQWLKTVSEMYPSLEFSLYWADEDYPSSGEIETEGSYFLENWYKHENFLAPLFVKKYFPKIYQAAIQN